ncbi:uncharacterized protein LOC125959641 [Anopheles darlingi]|uniref:uncharacterized protein LOC125959641 n=1 Tax=Anopheles darlingi TaxID=43151 RepID=UPI0021000BFD|nr:uncharacterized protein LOC125959641 [Anopheles darlingi]
MRKKQLINNQSLQSCDNDQCLQQAASRIIEKMEDIESTSPLHLRKKKLIFTPETHDNKNSLSEVAKISETRSKILQTKNVKKKSYEQMICEAILENDTNRKGVSFLTIKKFIKGKYLIEGEINLYVKRAYEKLIVKESIEHVTGSGTQGSIRFTKTHWEQTKRPEKKGRATKVTKAKTEKNKPSKDKNNNRKKGKEEAKPMVKVQAKKTALTRAKLDKTSSKVRLSITTPVPPKPTKGGLKGKTRMQQPEVISTPMTKPQPKLAKKAEKQPRKPRAKEA